MSEKTDKMGGLEGLSDEKELYKTAEPNGTWLYRVFM